MMRGILLSSRHSAARTRGVEWGRARELVQGGCDGRPERERRGSYAWY